MTKGYDCYEFDRMREYLGGYHSIKFFGLTWSLKVGEVEEVVEATSQAPAEETPTIVAADSIIAAYPSASSSTSMEREPGNLHKHTTEG